ncbi:MAG TPA: AbrB/MazE/SpoVT family DNA-binding domain-containing protein [Allosphingosinicella sp.]|jgi:AbrB family looped-hinge helix DNA binding protein
MNAHTRLSAKGHIVIPKPVRDRLCWAEGADLELIETADGVLLRPVQPSRERITIEEFRRRVPPHVGPPATLEDMEQAIDQAMAERWRAKEARSR